MAAPRILLTRPLPFGASSLFPPDWDIRLAAVPAEAGDPPGGLADADGLLCLLTDEVRRPWIDAAPALRIVANIGVGYNNIDWEYARSRGVVVTNTPGALTEATADLAMALILACSRRLLEADRLTREGKFTGWDLELCLGLELSGAVLGIVGMGRIGRAVARRAAAFGMKVLYTRRGGEPGESLDGCTGVPFEELLATADVVSIHCPLTAETRHLFGAAAFSRMKPGSLLVNTSRGPVVDEGALAEALASGRLAAAGLDVYEREPEVHPRLLALPNVVLLPHIGSATEKTRRAITRMAVGNIVSFFTEGKAVNPVW